ncbi:hypothetical protein [Sporosarcina limicola]|uniref:Uncharacterized protein n=1 Tax=Sporosarcina limicola TaxID=34101 RepID=A0A927R409_9BACL|nr:hypothetical protein [Sporosarcina limicola]MBE1555661.1 hypothetical protein [Sporosarcina limicola]
MFVVDQGLNKITKIANKTFQELGIREREHLQEWIADNTECLGEELLIIQKEFDDFDDTNERSVCRFHLENFTLKYALLELYYIFRILCSIRKKYYNEGFIRNGRDGDGNG